MDFPIEYQKKNIDCGPTALKMIAAFWGKDINLERLCQLCNITPRGVSLKGLIKGAEDIGLHALSIKCSFNNLITHVPLPAIALWQKHHFVVVYEIDDYHIYVADPMFGRVCYTYGVFCHNWLQDDNANGILLVFEPEKNESK